MVHAAASAVGAWLDKPNVFERGDDAVVVDAVGDIVGLFLEEVRRIAHGETDIDGVHQRDVIAGVADAVYGSVVGIEGVEYGLDTLALGAFARRNLGHFELELVKAEQRLKRLILSDAAGKRRGH